MDALSEFAKSDRGWVAVWFLGALLLWESPCPFLPFFRSRTRAKLVHGLLNVLQWGFNALLVVAFFTSAWTWASHLADTARFGLLRWISGPAWAEANG